VTASPDEPPPKTRRPARTWVILLIVWAIGLAVWTVYIAAIAGVFVHIFG
jgi:hypothetical protein